MHVLHHEPFQGLVVAVPLTDHLDALVDVGVGVARVFTMFTVNGEPLNIRANKQIEVNSDNVGTTGVRWSKQAPRKALQKKSMLLRVTT